LSLGIIRGRESTCTTQQSDNAEYFKYLEGQPPSTKVKFVMNNKDKVLQRVGMMEGIFVNSGRKAIKVCYVDDKRSKIHCTRLFYINDCHNISILNQDSDIDISTYRKKGSSVIRSKDFLSEVAPEVNMSILATTSRLDCLFIGTQKRLLHELNINFIANNTKRKWTTQGTLRDIIRPKNNTQYSKSYRSLICSEYMKKELDPDEKAPWCVIFDSADGYLKWHQLFETINQIIVLDRTEKWFDEAAAHVNQRYYRRGDALPAFVRNLPPTLDGIETIYFTEH
ncbi:MAG TPA: hypothetical protein PKV35_11175, partial [bacterium]|nr:hypothetical protein [bacterium]